MRLYSITTLWRSEIKNAPRFQAGRISTLGFPFYFSTGNWISVTVSGSVWLPFFAGRR